MGICIDYSGKLDDLTKLDQLVADVRQTCDRLQWTYTEVSKHFSGIELGSKLRLLEADVRGIYVHPPNTEWLKLTFDKRGRLCHYGQIPYQMIAPPVSPDGIYYHRSPLWVKTNGEVEVHILIVALLERLRQDYMSNLKISDPTGFAKTKDLERLMREHAAMSLFLGTLQNPENLRALMQAAGRPLPPDARIKLLSNPIPERPKTRKAVAGQSN